MKSGDALIGSIVRDELRSAFAVNRPLKPLTPVELAAELSVDLWEVQALLLEDVCAVEESVWALGRRSGKSTAAAICLLWDALYRRFAPDAQMIGEPRYSIVVATRFDQACLVVQMARRLLKGRPHLERMIASESRRRIVFTSGAIIEAFPASASALRGLPVSLLIMDEVAHMRGHTGNASAAAIYNAARPGLAQFGGDGRVITASTPFGDAGFFADRFRFAASSPDPRFVARQYSTFDANPTISRESLEHLREHDPWSFDSEYEAKFVPGGDAFLNRLLIQNAATLDGDLPPTASIRWWIGIDPGFSLDLFGVVVVGISRTTPHQFVVGAVRQFTCPPTEAGEIDVDRQRAIFDEVAELARRYGVRRIATDQGYERLVAQSLADRNLKADVIRMDASTKSDIYLDLRSAFHREEIVLQNDRGLLEELCALRSQVSPGKAIVTNPRANGSHGDAAQALALALHQAGPLRHAEVYGEIYGEDASLSDGLASDLGHSSISEVF